MMTEWSCVKERVTNSLYIFIYALISPPSSILNYDNSSYSGA